MEEFKPYSDPRDVEMESSIYTRLRDMGSHLHVKVNGGEVILSGTAEDYDEKRDMDAAVRMMGGVHHVVNQIRVVSMDERFDNYR